MDAFEPDINGRILKQTLAQDRLSKEAKLLDALAPKSECICKKTGAQDRI